MMREFQLARTMRQGGRHVPAVSRQEQRLGTVMGEFRSQNTSLRIEKTIEHIHLYCIVKLNRPQIA